LTNPKTPRRMARPPYDPDEAGSERSDLQNTVPAEKRITKQSQVIAMLRMEGGTTLAAIVEATGWQAHTVRAALTGLRKKNHAIERSSVDGETRYRIVQATAE
jgi:DNA-binding MarR family transcriptional regulator